MARRPIALARLAERVAGLTGWQRGAAAALAGAVSVLALPPVHVWPVLFLTFPFLVWLLDGAAGTPRTDGKLGPYRHLVSAAATGWCFGFGYFLAGLYWIGFAFLVDTTGFGWLLPFAVTLMPSGLALFFAAAAATAMLAWRPGAARVLALAIALTAFEWLRGHVLTGFPWNLIGYALTAGETLMQWAALFGIYGLTLLAVAIFASPAVIWATPAMATERAMERFGAPLAAVAALAAALVWGMVRLDAAAPGAVENVRLRIVQPSIPQVEKWQPGNRSWIFGRYLDLSWDGPEGAEPALAGITHLIWPESALPLLLADTPQALDAIARLLPAGTSLITGAARGEFDYDAKGSLVSRRFYNSLFVMNDEARILSRYDKVRLVPFGEFLPFQQTLEAIGLRQLTKVRGGFRAGPGPVSLTPPGAPPFSPLICYEVIFPDTVTAPGDRPGWLLNVTNDAWFGLTSGPYQHLHQARVRAVEQGLPLVRAANNGISAIIDPYGRILARLTLDRQEALDGPLPKPIPPTLFAERGQLVLSGLLLLALLGCWASARRRPRAA